MARRPTRSSPTSGAQTRRLPTSATTSRRRWASEASSSLLQRLLQIGDDVFLVLEPDRQPHHVGAGTGLRLLLVRQLLVRGRGRMDDQRARVADVGEVREQLDV